MSEEEFDVNGSKFSPLNLNKFKTEIDENGRVCSHCGEYKLWDNYYAASRTSTGKQSLCKPCKHSQHPKQNYAKKERISAKKRAAYLKKSDPVEYRVRGTRSKLLAREKKHPHLAGTTPPKDDIKKWLEDQYPYHCYYSGEPLGEKLHVDHKEPVQRGGTNDLSNLCLASAKMNTAKGGLNEQEFRQLLDLIKDWEGGGERLLRRLRQGFYG